VHFGCQHFCQQFALILAVSPTSQVGIMSLTSERSPDIKRFLAILLLLVLSFQAVIFMENGIVWSYSEEDAEYDYWYDKGYEDAQAEKPADPNYEDDGYYMDGYRDGSVW
jgi:hypothetical protein